MIKLKILVITFLVTTASFSQVKNFIDQPYIETSARVDTLVTPDQIYLSILITEKDTKGKLSVENLENKMALSLKNLGIDLKKQLTLTDVSSNFKKYFLRQQDVIKSKAYFLLVYDALTTGKVITALEKINISNVHINKVKYANIEKLILMLKEKAIKKAKQNAMVLTKAIKEEVGDAIYISDLQNIHYNNNQFDGNFKIRDLNTINDDKENSVDIEFDKIKVSASIRAKFKIE